MCSCSPPQCGRNRQSIPLFEVGTIYSNQVKPLLWKKKNQEGNTTGFKMTIIICMWNITTSG